MGMEPHEKAFWRGIQAALAITIIVFWGAVSYLIIKSAGC